MKSIKFVLDYDVVRVKLRLRFRDATAESFSPTLNFGATSPPSFVAMSEDNLQSPIPTSGQVADQDAVAASADVSQAPRGEHEDEENVQHLNDAISTTESNETHASRPIVDTQPDESRVVQKTADLIPEAPEAKASSAIAKPKPSVKPPIDKSIGGTATPTVKKARVQRVDETDVC
jgi:hypothetical protein